MVLLGLVVGQLRRARGASRAERLRSASCAVSRGPMRTRGSRALRCTIEEIYIERKRPFCVDAERYQQPKAGNQGETSTGLPARTGKSATGGPCASPPLEFLGLRFAWPAPRELLNRIHDLICQKDPGRITANLRKFALLLGSTDAAGTCSEKVDLRTGAAGARNLPCY